MKMSGNTLVYNGELISGINNAGETVSLNTTADGHIEVALHAPRLPFGSIHTESLTPVFQTDGVYGVNPQQTISHTGLSVGTGSGTGSVTNASNVTTAATGTTQYSFATFQSRRRLRYRAGQGLVGRFAGFFTGATANCILVAGFGTAESGYYFGYNGTSFGILHSTGGVRELQTMTITTASTATNDYVITLPNTGTVNVTATNNGNTARTAFEIAQGTYPGWAAESRGSTVIFLASSVGPKTGTFSLAQTGAVTPAAASVVETTSGVAGNDAWVPQASWNGADKLDGNGASGVTLDPTKGNVYEITVQYLGFGSVDMRIEVVSSNSNNPDFVTVHTFKHPNALTAVHLSQPSLPFTAAAYSTGSTTNATVNIGSYAGFIEGEVHSIGPRQSYTRDGGVTSSTSAYVPLFTVRNSLSYASRANQSVVNLLGIHGAAKSNQGITTFYLVKNAVLTGNINYQAFDSSSCTYWDTAATACTFTNGDIEFACTVSESGNFNYSFADKEITLQPGEYITLCVKSVTATAVCIASLNTREDQ